MPWRWCIDGKFLISLGRYFANLLTHSRSEAIGIGYLILFKEYIYTEMLIRNADFVSANKLTFVDQDAEQ